MITDKWTEKQTLCHYGQNFASFRGKNTPRVENMGTKTCILIYIDIFLKHILITFLKTVAMLCFYVFAMGKKLTFGPLSIVFA